MKSNFSLGLIVLRLQVFFISCILLLGITSEGALVIQHEEYGPSWRQGNVNAVSIVKHGWVGPNVWDYTTPYINSRVSTEGLWFMDWGPGSGPVEVGGYFPSFSNCYYYSYDLPNTGNWAASSIVRFNVPVTYASILSGAAGYRHTTQNSDSVVSAYLNGTLVASSHVPAWHSYLIHDPAFTNNPLNGQTFDEIRITAYNQLGLYIGIDSVTVDFVPEVSTSVLLVVSCCLTCRRRRLP